MKNIIFTILFYISFTSNNIAQNAMINILTQKSGIVKLGEKSFLEVVISNTNSRNYIGIYKLKAQISVPKDIITIDTIGHIIPTGWKILSQNNNTITLTNAKDMLSAIDNRTILISFKAIKIGGPSTLTGQLLFSNGIEPGTEIGTLIGDLPGDNYSTSTCKVIE